MSMETISQQAVTAFRNIMHHNSQQLDSRLQPYVDTMPMDSEDVAYDGIGNVMMREIFSRNEPSQFDDIEHFRRRLTKREFVITLPINDSDVESRLADPTSDYVKACVAATKRQFDQVVVDAMFADVATGRNFGTTVTFAGEGGLTVDATAGVTYPKLLDGIENFIDQEVDRNSMVAGITGSVHTALMQITQLTSGDYSRQMVVDGGTIQKAAGIDLVTFGATPLGPAQAILPNISGTVYSFLMVKGAMVVGIARDWKITLKDRPDLVNVKQLQITGVIGALRKEAAKIQRFNFTA